MGTSTLESSKGRFIIEFKVFRAFCILKLTKEVDREILYVFFNCWDSEVDVEGFISDKPRRVGYCA